MKKKVYFIISTIIQILFSAYLIVFANEIIQTQIDSMAEIYKIFPADFAERVNTILEKSGPPFLIVTSIICIVFSTILLIFTIRNKVSQNKGILIFFSAMTFLFASHIVISGLAIANLIVILCIKPDPNEVKKEKVKKEIPKLEEIKVTKKSVIFAVLLLVLYFSQLLWAGFLPDNKNIRFVASIVFDLILLAVSILVFAKNLKRDICALKGNVTTYIKYILPRYGIMYLIFIVTSLLSILLSDQGVSVNQNAVESLPIWYSFPLAVIWAPIVEELLFRGCLRRFFKNNVVFIIASAVIFGLIHTINEPTLISAIVHALPYSVLGGFFAYLYSKTNNITSNMFCHFLHNLIAMSLSLLML